MRRIKIILTVAVAVAAMVVLAAPSMADDDRRHDRFDDRHDLFFDDDLVFFGYPYLFPSVDVDYDNVRERNPKDGDCLVEDLDLDGFIAEWEITCYY